MNTDAQAYAHAFTGYKHRMHFGPSFDTMAAAPKPPVTPTVPVPISKGNVRGMLASLAQDCTNSSKFNDEIGIALGIVTPIESGKDIVAVIPKLSIKHTNGGYPILHASKGIYQGYEVWKDWNDGKGYLKLDTSLYPDYTDVSALPEFGKGATWKYKIIYLLKGEHSGSWSPEVTIGVYGEV